MSLPQELLSDNSLVNLREALGDDGGRLEQIWDWMCSQTRLNRLMLPAIKAKSKDIEVW